MADLARIKRNVAKMASMNAPEADIDGYISSEGVTVEQVRNFKQIQPTSTETINKERGRLLELPGLAKTEQKIAARERPFDPLMQQVQATMQNPALLLNPDINNETARNLMSGIARSIEAPIANVGMGIQKGEVSPILPQLDPRAWKLAMQGITGQRTGEYGDIMRNVGTPELLASGIGVFADMGMGMPVGVGKTAARMGTKAPWVQAGKELGQIGKFISSGAKSGFGKVYTKAKDMLNAGKDLRVVQAELANKPLAQLELRNAVRDARVLKGASVGDMTENFKVKNKELVIELKKETQLQSGVNKEKIRELGKNMSATYRNGLDEAESELANRGVTITTQDYINNVIDKTNDELLARGMPEDAPAFIAMKKLRKALTKDKQEIMGAMEDFSRGEVGGGNILSIIKSEGGIKSYKKGLPGALGEEYLTNVPLTIKNKAGKTLDEMADLLKDKYPHLNIQNESDLLNVLSESQNPIEKLAYEFHGNVTLNDLRNFKNSIYDKLSSGVRAGSKWADVDDQVANIFLKNHGEYVGNMSPELKQLNAEFTPMANARQWASKTFRPFNDAEIQRGANVLEKIAKSEVPNQTDMNYLKYLEEGHGRFPGAGNLKGRTVSVGKNIRQAKETFELAKKNLIDASDYKINQLQERIAELQKRGIILKQNEERLKELIKLRRKLIGIVGAGAIFGGLNAGRRIIYNVANQ